MSGFEVAKRRIQTRVGLCLKWFVTLSNCLDLLLTLSSLELAAGGKYSSLSHFNAVREPESS